MTTARQSRLADAARAPLTVGRTYRFGLLLAAMCVEMMLAPLMAATPHGLLLTRVLTTLVLVAALVAARARHVAIGLFALAAIPHLIAVVTGSLVATRLAAAARMIFLLYVCWRIVRHVLTSREVTIDTIAAASCAYMLLGLIWGALFFLLEEWQPGSFEIPTTFLAPGFDRAAALMYFSMATLTTVGYGDIHPTNPAMGSVAVAESIVGQLYLAIMIARMVGLHAARRSD